MEYRTKDPMSNPDSNGIEREWILAVYRSGLCRGYRIERNPACSQAAQMDDSWALSTAMRDAILHMQPEAADAVYKHIRDAHLWAK